MDRLDSLSGLLSLALAALNVLFAGYKFRGEDSHHSLENLLAPQSLRFPGRLMLTLAIVMVSALALTSGNLIAAGIGLMTASGVRLASPRSTGWEPERLAFHISTEVWFHCIALFSFAAGFNVLALGALKDLQTGQRLTVTLTLALASCVAVNKSTTRTRKLCTEISSQVYSLTQHMAALHNLAVLNEDSEKIPDK
ncbi:hypothetical protein ACWGII_26195 [Streptomyces sp. NPDC054855]